jgi:hypothetical protein
MKSTFKISALVLAFAGFALGAKAQTSPASTSKSVSSSGIMFSIGADGGLPVGKLKDSHNASIGGSLEAGIPVSVFHHRSFMTLTGGYNSIQGKNNINGTGSDAPDIQLLPVRLGLKTFLISNFYLQGEAGAAFLLNKSDLNVNKSAVFDFSQQVGVQLPLGGKSYLDAGVRYEGTSKFSSSINNSKVNIIGLRVAYAFAVK